MAAATSHTSGARRAATASAALAAMLIGPAAFGQLVPERIDSTNRANNADQTRREPVNVIDNVWWVGHSAVGAILVTSDEGHILIDTTSTELAPWTVENIVSAGFQLDDIRYILNTHPHEEHMGGTALFKKLIPDALLLTSKENADVMATGGRTDFRYIVERDETDLFEPVQVDGLLRHGDEISVGDATVVAHLTPGHTEGTTTFTTTVTENGREYDVVIYGGMSASGTDRAPLIDNPWYPDIARDFQASFDYLRTLECDVYLYPRAVSIELDRKLAERKASPGGGNPFVDPEGCAHYVDFYETRFLKQLEEERAARR
ncbi:MAG: MBL fold metallo-hydrolase [Woeseiaceae bacterium]|nr:MBL fold metallo-hydrolase [Woeseiaceae bacterium]